MDVALILLAAGASRRMGSSKPLLPLGDRPVIARCLESVVAAGIGDIVVVVGPRGELVAEAVRLFPVTLAVNPDPASDMAGSVREGLKAVPPDATGVLISLADHPLVAPETYRALLDHHRREPEAILIPTHEGKKGHPTLFPRLLLMAGIVQGTLRDIIRANPERVRLVDLPDRGVTLDMDTPEDYRKTVGIFNGRSAGEALPGPRA